MRYRTFIALAAVVAGASPAQSQLASRVSATVAPSYRAFSLDESLAATSISLLMIPVAVEVPIGSRFLVDAFAGYALGSAETSAGTFDLAGPVDTRVRATWAAAPNLRVTLGLNLPTGHGTHSNEEAQVAALLSTDLLGFREASFGTGAATTAGVALAHELGAWGVGYGASYRLTSDFQPSEETETVYAPGNEAVVRLALDRNVGAGGKLTLGGTFQHFTEDEYGDNLFEPGARVRADASYAFRAGTSSTVTVFATDLWRQRGQTSLLSVPGSAGTVGAQNVVILGGVARLGGRLAITPSADLRILSHEEGTGSGWVGGAGAGLTTRVAGLQLVPRARLMIGAIESAAGEAEGVTGFEIELAARF